MSLLNDMLRDLDARRSRPADLGTLALAGVAPALSRNVPRLPLGRLALGIALAVGLAATGVYLAAQLTAVAPALPVTTDDALSTPGALAAAIPATLENAIPVTPPATPTTESPVRPPEPPAITVATTTTARNEPAPTQPVRSTPEPRATTRPTVAEPARPAAAIQTRVRALSPEEQAQQAFERGVAALRQDQAQRAETLWREALALQPGHEAARLALAGLQAHQQRSAEALALLAAGQALDPGSVELARLRGHLLLQQGRPEEARRVLENAAPAARAQADYQALLGTLYQRLGLHDLAVEHYRRALARQPDQGLWWMGLGVSLDQSREADAAREAYRTALGYGLSPALQDYLRGRLAALVNPDG